jgi:hypothetical protein
VSDGKKVLAPIEFNSAGPRSMTTAEEAREWLAQFRGERRILYPHVTIDQGAELKRRCSHI